jgi:hypothetical protein
MIRRASELALLIVGEMQQVPLAQQFSIVVPGRSGKRR